MTQVAELIRNQRPLSIAADQTVLEAARFMSEHNIGAVPVLADGELIGMFTERDLMRRVVAAGRSPAVTRVSEVMTARPRTVSLEETVEECLFLMREHGFRHLPVCEGKKLKGLLSLRDLLMRSTANQSQAKPA
jgi:CBS domain-containing protein